MPPKTISLSGLETKNSSTTFRDRVFDVVRTIPAGQTLTYKQVAEMAGSPKAFRAVGNILNTNYNPEIPCHRVVRSDGTTGGYNRGAEQKKIILQKERNTAKEQ